MSHVAVLKWEKTKDHLKSMNWTTEKDIRLFILSKLIKKTGEIAELYFIIEKLPAQKTSHVNLDMKKVA